MQKGKGQIAELLFLVSSYYAGATIPCGVKSRFSILEIDPEIQKVVYWHGKRVAAIIYADVV